MIHQSLLASAVGGLLWLDRFQFCQVMISRPIVAAPIVGWSVGDVAAGAAAGIIFELLWLRRPPVGGFIAPDVTMASVATAAVSAGIRSSTDVGVTAVVFLSFLFLLPLCFVGRKVDELVRLGLGRIARVSEAAQLEGRDRILSVHFLAALALGFSAAFVVLVPTIICFTFLLGLILPALPQSMIRALGFGFYVVPLVGAADCVLGLEQSRHKVFFVAGLIAAVVVGFVLY